VESTVVSINIDLDVETHYFEGLGELLGKQVSELCSRGNMSVGIAAEIYQSLATELLKINESESLSKSGEIAARSGFENAYGENFIDEESESIEEETTEISPYEDYIKRQQDRELERERSPWGVRSKFNGFDEVKKVNAVFEKFLEHRTDRMERPLEIFADEIAPRIEDFIKADEILEQLLSESELRVEKNKQLWKQNASLEEIMQNEENNILFYDSIIDNYKWKRFLDSCINYLAQNSTEKEISDFIDSYKKFPKSYRTIDIEEASSLIKEIREFRESLSARLSEGLFIRELSNMDENYKKMFNSYTGLKFFVDELVEDGRVIKEKKNGKVFYRTESNIW
jgi:hypothetical protein